ncbi:MAG: pimeloyl-ACP methyl ester carboxylesterase [Hyphomicrobiaceae bacterium]|jgi:pimeloyl-ACP methyl ester carboxylesterase
MSGAEPQSKYVTVMGREVHYMEWGTPGNQPLVMWHGLARTGRDFDWIAAELSDRFHIICPDTIGRGWSEWSDNADADYCFDVYAEHACAVVDAVGWERVHWLGTSMGGSLGMRVAATTLKGRINKLLINDIGPTFPEAPFERIKQYIGNPPEFGSISEIEAYFREIYKPFGPHTDTQWRHMAETSSRRLPSGQITTHYDPGLVRQMFAHPGDYELWDHYDAIDCPTLVLHGVNSDLLLPEIASEMTRRGPKAAIAEIEQCGHAPGLVTDGQMNVVRDFFEV